MPGLAVAGVAVRSGCVMLAIDLHAMGGGSGSIADAILVECLSEAVQEMTADIGVNRFTVQVRCAHVCMPRPARRTRNGVVADFR